MASPVVLRRSARLTAKATVAAAAVSCEQSTSSSSSSGQEIGAAALKLRKSSTKAGKKATSALVKEQESLTLTRGKISAYYSNSTSTTLTTITTGKKKQRKDSKVTEEEEEEAAVEEIACHVAAAAEKPQLIVTEVNSTEEVTVTDTDADAAANESGDGAAARVLVKRVKKLKHVVVPSRDMEAELWELGFRHVAGVDEAGRGPLAGPVVAAACIIPASVCIEGINDSKKLSEEKREELYSQLTTTPGISYAVHVVDAQMIDEINILQATMHAMTVCVEKLNSSTTGLPCPDFILIDGNRLPVDIPETKARSVIKGDASCHVIAAASVLAKVTRDRLMINYDEKWPIYGFKSHKGYGTAEHIKALLKHGPCDIHRRSFAPLKDQTILSKTDLQALQGEDDAK